MTYVFLFTSIVFAIGWRLERLWRKDVEKSREYWFEQYWKARHGEPYDKRK